jgi:adenine-specific DNA glycosylase
VTHGFTHRTLRLHVYRAAAPAGRVRRRDADAHRWLPLAALEALPLSALAKKALVLARAGAERGGSTDERSGG